MSDGDRNDDDGFNRLGNPDQRQGFIEALAHQLGVPPKDVRRRLKEFLKQAESGRLNDTQIMALQDAVDQIQRIDAFDHPWTFGHRYHRHKFISTDPTCRNCRNQVPHRTMLVCPTCGFPGPWEMAEHMVKSSYIHYYLTEQVKRLLETSLLLDGGASYADGITTAMPRGGAKSTWMCEIVGSWLILTGRSRCLLLLSNTIEQVTDRCNEIRMELEGNDLIIADFGVQAAKKTETRTWSKGDFTLPNRARVVGRGANQSMRGVKNKEYRPDVAIGDDTDDEKYMTSPQQAEKIYEWWDKRVVPACHPNAVFLNSGTIIGELGLLWQMLSTQKGGTSVKQIFRALRDIPGCKNCGFPQQMVGPFDCHVCGERSEAIQPSSYWGARFTNQALLAIKAKIGIWAWETEYDQTPHDSSRSWFQKEWIDRACRPDLAPLAKNARRIIPWGVIECTLNGTEALTIAGLGDDRLKQAPGDIGPYQAIVQAWDPAWARLKGKEQLTAWMGGIGMGLTWDDKFDIFWISRTRGLSSSAAYRKLMHESWVRDIVPMDNDTNMPGQVHMIIEANAAGVMFQYQIEEYWSSIPMISHQTGAEKHDLRDGIPGFAGSFEKNDVIIRTGGSAQHQADAEELKYELQQSGRSQYKDLLMAAWIAWAYLTKWMKIRDRARYDELQRRDALANSSRRSPR